jgi:MFS transporter, DHA2 family, multidrug resistance protein
MTGTPAASNWVRSLLPFVVMCVGMFIALLDIQIVASSLQDIGGGLSAAQDQISWVQTAYLIAEIVMIPLSGWLTRVFSTRWLLTVSAAGFTLTSMLCGLAWNIESMILFRALQGLLGASMIPTVFTSSFHYFQGQRRVYSAAVIGTIASVAPTLGPVIGGWITDTLNWHWLFYINLVPGVAITALVPMLVRIDEPDLSLLKGADFPGIALMALALGTLEYVLEEGSRWNWFDDATIRDCALVAGVAGILFVIRSLTFARPVVDLRALGNRNFALGCFLSFVTGIGIFSTIYLTPLVLGYVRGFSAWQTGVAIFSTGAASLLGVPVYIVLARKFDTRWLLMFGLASFGLAMWSFSFITHDWGAAQLLLPQVLRGFPQVFAVAPSVNLGLGSLPPDRLKYASGLFNMMRNLGGAVGIAVCGAILNNRTNLHFHDIATHLTPANGAMEQLLHGLAARWGAAIGGPVAGNAAALSQLWHLVYREASTLAYADAFRAIMVAFIIATVLVPLLRKMTPPKTAPAEAHCTSFRIIEARRLRPACFAPAGGLHAKRSCEESTGPPATRR